MSQLGQYCIYAPLEDPIRSIHGALVAEIANQFGLTFTQTQGIEAHFTIKYHFFNGDLQALVTALKEFSLHEAPSEVSVNGFGNFAEEVIFLDVELSPAAKDMLDRFVSKLQELDWMQWSPHDAKGLHPHATIAEHCGTNFREVMEYLEDKELNAKQFIDRITLIKCVGYDGEIPRWEPQGTFVFRRPLTRSDSSE